MTRKFGFHFILLVGLIFPMGCSRNKGEQASSSSRFLYVTTGICYSGGNTTFSVTTSSNLVYRLNTSNASKDATLADYASFPASSGDSPTGIAEYDAENVLLTVESSAGRRTEIVKKSGPVSSSRSPFSSNTTILSAGLRSLLKLNDGSYLINKTTGIEKLTPYASRIGAPFIPTTLAGGCGNLGGVTSTATLSNGKILFSNAVAANNRFALISASGYSSAGDCLAVQTAPTAAAFPTAMVYIPSANQLIVAYAGNTVATDVNSIYVYTINESTNVISGATKIYDASLFGSTYNYLLYGISAMTFDPTDNSLYVSSAVTTATTVANYVIEKFTYDSTAKSLSRVGSTPFYSYGFDTKCVAGLMVGN